MISDFAINDTAVRGLITTETNTRADETGALSGRIDTVISDLNLKDVAVRGGG